MASRIVICLSDYEQHARETMAKPWFAFYSGGADAEVTLKENSNAFKRYQIIPRVMRDVSKVETGTSILGYSISFPVCIAPTAFHGYAHPTGEVGTARGAKAMNIGYGMSTYSSCSIDEVADGAGDSLRFFQLHLYTRRDLVLGLVRWAERRGFKALILTIDMPVLGNRTAYKRLQLPKFEEVKRGVLHEFGDENFIRDPSVTWEDVKWLRNQTKLPLILKGILSAEDAVLAVESGASGILVSTHGGRQLDTIPASIDVLADVAKAVNGRCEVYMDGGIRRGTDILKALALGARVVFIGRPAIYALAYNGEDGVSQMLHILREEFSTAMALSGCSCINDIRTVPVIRHRSLESHL